MCWHAHKLPKLTAAIDPSSLHQYGETAHTHTHTQISVAHVRSFAVRCCTFEIITRAMEEAK